MTFEEAGTVTSLGGWRRTRDTAGVIHYGVQTTRETLYLVLLRCAFPGPQGRLWDLPFVDDEVTCFACIVQGEPPTIGQQIVATLLI